MYWSCSRHPRSRQHTFRALVIDTAAHLKMGTDSILFPECCKLVFIARVDAGRAEVKRLELLRGEKQGGFRVFHACLSVPLASILLMSVAFVMSMPSIVYQAVCSLETLLQLLSYSSQSMIKPWSCEVYSCMGIISLKSPCKLSMVCCRGFMH